MYYIVERTFELNASLDSSPESVAQGISENLEEDGYIDMLNECYGPVELCGMTYDAAHVLESVDPIAYRCGFSDWQDSQYSDILWTLEHMEDGGVEYYDDYEIHAFESYDDAIDYANNNHLELAA